MFSLFFNAGVASAAYIPSSGCGFRMSGINIASNPLSELSGGKVLFGDVPEMSLRIEGDKIWNLQGHGCLWNSESQILSCAQNQIPDAGFQIGCSGRLSFRGQNTFYQCAGVKSNQYNVYLNRHPGVSCAEIYLHADSCLAKADAGCASVAPQAVLPVPLPAPVVQEAPIVQDLPIVQETPIIQEAPIVQAPVVQAPVQIQGCAAAKLLQAGAYERPQLIIPVDKAIPDKAFGLSYYGQITSSKSALFNFNIPQAYTGQSCSLVYSLPTQEQLSTLLSGRLSNLPFTLSNVGKLNFSMLKAPISLATTWNNQPSLMTNYGVHEVTLGNSYTIASFPCPAGQNLGFAMTDYENAQMSYLQDYQTHPMGLYITKC